MPKFAYLILPLIIVIAIGAFLLIGDTPNQGQDTTKTSSSELLDEFLTEHNASPTVAAAYHFALENPEGLLDELNCHCGCMETGEHDSNHECFINEEEGSGESYDLMGLNCGTCVATALLAKEMYEDGKTREEIQQAVEDRFNPNQI